LKGTPNKQQLHQINPNYKQPPLPDLNACQIQSRLEPGIPSDAYDLIEKLLSYVP
jgi:hypothetical protein